jgi:8-oxo-dGTP pyrophosphatase MutT (NUDIX family)
MHPSSMSAANSRLPAVWSRARAKASPKFLQLAHLCSLRRSTEQVAAVCYRARNTGIEFLLVQTRSGRWTFPKGNAEPGLTHAQAAALEAFEEAGVHGRIEEAAFARYTRRKRTDSRSPDATGLTVSAHLCEVSWLDPPQEFDRNPTWFSAPQAKRHLRGGRKPDYAAEFARVVDRAVARIRRLNAGDPKPHAEALQKVAFIDGTWRPSK